MSVPITSAVEEAGEYLAFFKALGDGVTVQQLAEYPWPYLTLGTIRALHALGADIARYASLFTAEELEQAISRQQR